MHNLQVYLLIKTSCLLAPHALLTLVWFCTPFAAAMHECLLCHNYLLTFYRVSVLHQTPLLMHTYMILNVPTCMCDSGQAPGSPQLPEGQDLCHHWHSGLPVPW